MHYFIFKKGQNYFEYSIFLNYSSFKILFFNGIFCLEFKELFDQKIGYIGFFKKISNLNRKK